MRPEFRKSGFTLIELSIVLVIIGLVVGGVLVGRDLISGAGARAQISQIASYRSAAYTFREKYGGLPGDLPAAYATQFGFAARGQYAGEGDGNGILQGIYSHAAANNYGYALASGENTLFWVDLTAAKLIDGSFTTATATSVPSAITSTMLPRYYPPAKAGMGTPYVYMWSAEGKNNFTVASLTTMYGTTNNTTGIATTFPVKQAHAIDSKMDDGLPVQGNVFTALSYSVLDLYTYSAGQGLNYGGASGEYMATWPIAGSSTSCFDNGNVAATQQYSLTQTGNTPNCVLAFRL